MCETNSETFKNARRNMLRKARSYATNLTKSMNLNRNSPGRELVETQAKTALLYGISVLIKT